MTKRKEQKKEKKNPYHHEYGMLSNTRYIIGKIRRYCPTLFILMIIGIFTNPIVQCLFSFIGKFVIDIVQAQADSPAKDFSPLLKLLLITSAVELGAMLVNAVTDNKRWYYMIYTRTCIITERVKKALSMNYQMLEQPDILDMEEKARSATGNNTEGVEGMMRASFNLGAKISLLLLTLTTVLALDWRMLFILAFIGVLQHAFFRYTVKKDRREVWDKLAPTWRKIRYMEQTTQNADYAKDIRLFSMKDWLIKKQHRILAEEQNKIFYSHRLWAYNAAAGTALSTLATAVVYAILILAVVDRNLSIGDFTLYLGLSMTFNSAVYDTLSGFGTLKKCSLEIDNFRSFMELPVDELPDPDFSPAKKRAAKRSFGSADAPCGKFTEIPQTDRYTFTFRNVCFRYEGAAQDALHNLNLTLSPGERLAVVGLNGAGKTTFIKLLLRLYDVTSGEILLNGINIKRFERNAYYRLFAPVFQDTELFAFPMAENVSMLPPQQTDREKATNCLIQAGLGDKLHALKRGVDTELLKILHDDGVDLSGGERQKLALARALYKDVPVIVLDEPTAALDALAEYNLYRNFDSIIGNKSAVYISHRLSSTRFCHHIAMFREGEMVEYGSHEELLSQNGAYAEMFHIQSQYYQEEGKEAAVSV